MPNVISDLVDSVRHSSEAREKRRAGEYYEDLPDEKFETKYGVTKKQVCLAKDREAVLETDNINGSDVRRAQGVELANRIHNGIVKDSNGMGHEDKLAYRESSYKDRKDVQANARLAANVDAGTKTWLGKVLNSGADRQGVSQK